jgi:hypothetical protein
MTMRQWLDRVTDSICAFLYGPSDPDRAPASLATKLTFLALLAAGIALAIVALCVDAGKF